MGDYFALLLKDKRVRITAVVGAVALVLAVVCGIVGGKILLSVAIYGLLPILLLSFLACLGVSIIIIRNDYLERKGLRSRD